MSSFQTVGRIGRIRSYADAKAKYESVKPIRGSDNLRPIGERRDAARYYIKQVDTFEYQAFLYNTPIITFYPNDEIRIKTYGHDTALSMDFISQVLGIPAYRTRGQCVFEVEGVKFVTSGHDGELLLQRQAGNRYLVIGRQCHKQYVISRSGANNVRRRYSEFRAYLKGFLSLRTQTLTFEPSPYAYHQVAETRDLIEINMAELAEHLGTIDREDGWGSNVQMNKYIDTTKIMWLANITSPHYTKSNEEFIELIKNDQPEETKTANFYKACLMLTAAVDSENSISATRDYIRRTPTAVKELIDEIQFKWHSKEVLVIADVAEGKVPNHKYNSWVRMPVVN